MSNVEHITITGSEGITLNFKDGTSAPATKASLKATSESAAREFDTYSNMLYEITGIYLRHCNETATIEEIDSLKHQREIGKMAGINECISVISGLALKAHALMLSADRALALISK